MAEFDYQDNIPGDDFNSQFKKQRVASQLSSRFIFCVIDYIQDNGAIGSPQIKKIGGFESIDGLNFSLDKDVFVHNTSKSTSELPKRVIYDNIVLRKAFDNGYFIKQWANSAIGSYAYMADILIGVLDITMHNIFRLIGVRNAWVSKYQNSQLNTNSADQWFEEVALSHNGIANLNFDDSLIVVDLYDEKEYTYGKSENFYSDSKSLLNYGSFVGNNNPLTIYDFFVNFKI